MFLLEPVEYLYKDGFIVDPWVDFQYDSNPKGPFNTVLCTYLLERTNKATEQMLLKEMFQLLNHEGNAFITVENIEYPFNNRRSVVLNLPILYNNERFVTYRMEKNEEF